MFQSKLTLGLMAVLSSSFFAIEVSAQASTDIYLAPVQMHRDGITVGPAMNVTRRAGYDNQPSFLPDGSGFLYSSMDESGQVDVFEYEIRSREIQRITQTETSEFSPTPMPEGRFSAVRVEVDSKQRLWSFDRNGGDPRLLLQAVEPVGYHAWLDDSRLLLFVLGDPHELHYADVRTGRSVRKALDIGRSLHRIPGTARASFVQADPVRSTLPTEEDGDTVDPRWKIRSYDPVSGAIEDIVQALPNSQDCWWAADGTLYMAEGSTLYRWSGWVSEERQAGWVGNFDWGRPDPVQVVQRASWVEVQDFSGQAMGGLRNITRIALSPDSRWMVFVGEERQ